MIYITLCYCYHLLTPHFIHAFFNPAYILLTPIFSRYLLPPLIFIIFHIIPLSIQITTYQYSYSNDTIFAPNETINLS